MINVNQQKDNQVTHRAIMPCYIRRLFQLCKDVLGKDFTKLNSHLIYDRKKIIMMSRQRKKKKKLPNELIPQITPCTKILCSYNAINAPTNKNKNKKVKSNIQEKKERRKRKPRHQDRKLTQSRRSQKREHDTRTRPITCKHFTLHQNIWRPFTQLLPNLFLRLPKRQSLRLSEKVGKKDTMMFRIIDGIVRGSGSNKIGRDEFGPLVNKLIERMLTVRTSSSPDDRL